jgi:hypothetical protein
VQNDKCGVMDFRKQRLSCEQARQMDMVSYLFSLGHEPAKIRNFDYWYLSPFRKEKTPSFKINRKLNRWYDHGLGRGGNLVDFAILYNDCTVGEFLKAIGHNFSFHPPIAPTNAQPKENKECCTTILKEGPLASFSLHRYLYLRRITGQVAERFCKEVAYELSGRKYFAIGFKNNSGGFELRNAFFKGSSTPKDMTTIETGAKEVAVFEGFFDFLSFNVLVQNEQPIKNNFLVLNSLSFFAKARPFMEKHNRINLYLDRDKSGQNCTRQALSLSGKYEDKSCLYSGYKDLNDWMMNIGKSSVHGLKEE